MDFREYDKSVCRFELDHSRPRKKLRCPQCGRERCFTPYVDVTSGQIVGEQFGICDHKNKCGYFKYPRAEDLRDKELFVDSNKVLMRFRPREVPDLANCIPVSRMLATLNPLVMDDLQSYLCGVFDPCGVRRTFDAYKVGTMRFADWGRPAVFWQIDREWVVRTGKIMRYENGKRVKEPFDCVYWAHVMDGHDYILKQCLFGEHLLNFYPPDAPAYVVESEKTALICNIVYPDKLFLACGGLYGLRMDTMGALRGRKVVLYPDKGEAFGMWADKARKDLYGLDVRVSDYLERTDKVGEKDDIGDLLIKNQIENNGKNSDELQGIQDDRDQSSGDAR